MLYNEFAGFRDRDEIMTDLLPSPPVKQGVLIMTRGDDGMGVAHGQRIERDWSARHKKELRVILLSWDDAQAVLKNIPTTVVL